MTVRIPKTFRMKGSVFTMYHTLEIDDDSVPISFEEDKDQNGVEQAKKTSTPLVVLMLALTSIFLLQIAGFAFNQIGIPVWLAFVIIPGALIGSLVNIPLYTIETEAPPRIEPQFPTDWGLSLQLIRSDPPKKTRISINLGGAIIPVLVSTYLILLNLSFLIPILIATLAVSIVVHRIARIRPNIGISTPALLPPLAAIIATMLVGAIFTGIINLYAIAYISGTLGTLIGADILNLGKLSQLKTETASIGGAGTSDGVFLTGLLAVLLL